MIERTDWALQSIETRAGLNGRPEQPRLTGDGKAIFLQSGPRDQRRCLYELDLATGEQRLLLSPARLAGGDESLSLEEKARRERLRIGGGGFVGYQLSRDGRSILIAFGGNIYVLDRESAKPCLIAEPSRGEALMEPKFSPDGACVSFARGRELCVHELATGRERALTQGAGKGVTRGVAEFIAQEEMGRFEGHWWAPDSGSVLCQETDESRVERFYIANPSDPARPPIDFAYPKAGARNADVRLGLIRVSDGAWTEVVWDREAYPYLAHVQWSANAPPTIQVQPRSQKCVLLLRVDPGTGATSELLRIEDPAWVNLHSGRNRGYQWLPDGSGFLWSRELEAGWSLELRSADGALVRVLTKPELGLICLLDLDGDAALVEAGPLPEQRVYRVPLSGSGPEPWPGCTSFGVHSAKLAPGRGSWLHFESTPTDLPRVHVRDREGRALAELPSVAIEPRELGTLEFLEAGPVHARALLIKPSYFDPALRYPVLVSVYGGPHHIRVLATREKYAQELWLAEQGFVVVCIDGRGSWGHGRAWERGIWRRLGSVPLRDQAETLKALGQRFEFLDLERVGVWGWSFGGYLSAMAVMLLPDFFKAAVSGAPVTDWRLYDTHYTERYMGLPQEEASAYEAESLLAHARRLDRPLLILHGTADDNVYFVHALKLADALTRAGRRFELLPLADQTHRVHDPDLAVRQWELTARFFREHLGQARERRASG